MTTTIKSPTLPSDVPRDGGCTFMVFLNRIGHGRCSKRATTSVTGFPKQDHRTRELVGDPFEAPCCGTHKRKAERGGSSLIFAGRRPNEFQARTLSLYTEATDTNKLKEQIEHAGWDVSTARSNTNHARTKAARAMFEQAPEILEMLFMVAERGDQRAWATIKTIQDGMSEVEKADEAYQALVRKIEGFAVSPMYVRRRRNQPKVGERITVSLGQLSGYGERDVEVIDIVDHDGQQLFKLRRIEEDQ